MKQCMVIALLCGLFSVFMTGTAAAGTDNSLFQAGVRAYEAGEYVQAAQKFEELAERGVVNGELYYDAGNAWFKADDLGRAVLWYKRAERLMPSDPDLAFNLGRASDLVRDRRPEPGYLERALQRWMGLWSPGAAAWIAVAVNFVFWGLLMSRRTGHPRFLGAEAGPWVRGARNTALVAAVVFTLTAGWWYCRDLCFQQGVVVAETAAARSGLGNLASKLFTLHAGTVVDVERTRDGHVLVRHGTDRVGWVSEDAVGII